MNAMPESSRKLPQSELTTLNPNSRQLTISGERAKSSHAYRVDNFEPQASQWLSDTGDIFHFCQSEIVDFLQ
jgi:hypothetical protein